MDEDGAVNLDERTTGKGYAAGAAGAAMTDTTRRDLDTTNTDKSIPIIEENLRVGKREVETGGVRVRSRIVEKPVEEHLRLREEHVHVERTPVNRAATPADLNSFKEGDISLTEHAEIPMVDKEARVVEEVRIGKDVEEHVENIHETVRKTDVDIDKLSSDELRNRRTDMDADANLTDEELRRRRMNTGPDRPKTL
ncbi:YsnF/AvaK domain-containing protein [Pontibacter saemangeumensis]